MKGGLTALPLGSPRRPRVAAEPAGGLGAGYAAPVFVLLLTACGAPPSSTPGELPVAYDVAPPAGGLPTITQEGATTALASVLASAFTYNADVMFQAYQQIMSFADETCPSVSAGDGGSMWDTNCTATSGAVFTGFISRYDGVREDVSQRRMRGEAMIDLPDGSQMVVAGELATAVSSGVAPSWSSDITGVMRYDGALAAGTWVEAESDVNLGYTLVADVNGAVQSVEMDGNVAGLEGEVSAVVFNDFVLDLMHTWPCPQEPAGNLRLRDVDGVWATLTFDVTGTVEEGFSVPEGKCDGCGDLMFEEESLGEVCVDMSGMFATEVPPW